MSCYYALICEYFQKFDRIVVPCLGRSQPISPVDPAIPRRLHCNENPIYVSLFWELRGLSPNFQFLDIPGLAHLFLAINFLGIFVSNFRY
jgi:hypothetical protein